MIKSNICMLMLILGIFPLFGCTSGAGSVESKVKLEEESLSATIAPKDWIKESQNPLVVPKLTNTLIDYGPADPTVMYDNESKIWKAWYSSSLKDIASGNNTMVIQYIESIDGIVWSTPIVSFEESKDPNAWDYTNVETPTVIKNPNLNASVNQKYMMWYAGANDELSVSKNRTIGFSYYQIGLAYSADGKFFSRISPGINNSLGLVLIPTKELFGATLPGILGDGVVADPEVLYQNNLFHMWFSCFAETAPVRSPLAYGLGHATSRDGVVWEFPNANPLATLYKQGDVSGGVQPSVLFNTSIAKYEMWFSNDNSEDKVSIPCSFNTVKGFWKATSIDGVIWSPDYTKRSLIYSSQLGYEALGFLTGVKVILKDDAYYAYYSSWGNEQIPDKSIYLCPDQKGLLMPGVLTLNRASLNSK